MMSFMVSEIKAYYIRKAEWPDVDEIIIIIEDARQFLKSQKLTQWQNGYGPRRPDVERDIRIGEGYVLIVNGIICGYAALMVGIDEYYQQIYNGRWDEGYDEYLSIHRVAVASSVRGCGYAGAFLNALVQCASEIGYHDIRIDTHSGNGIMEKVILGAGFSYKGMIRLPIPDGERKAFQRLVE